jgi:tetratricopeptide (TPR) repeat protein
MGMAAGDGVRPNPDDMTPPRDQGIPGPSAGGGGRASVMLGGGDWLFAAALLAATLVAYWGVHRAGFVWDDDGHVTRPEMRSLHGLWRTWFEPGSTQQYYPVLHSAFWLEHRLWGDAALGYHATNVLLHVAASFLLFRVLRRLRLPGARLAALVFALHPVAVESVAWISEEKNTLSAVFCLASALAYLEFDEGRRRGSYVLATALFAAALLSKSVAATLPAALLVIFWWRRGRLSWRGDVLPLMPWFILGAASGVMTAWMERTFIGARGGAYAMTLAKRFLVAGRAPWFYLGKLVWPAGLSFIYPHWNIDGRDARQYLYPSAVLAVLAVLFLLRNRSRGPLAAALLYLGTLSPALGFVSVYPFIYSYVADHFQYMAAAAAISAGCAGLTIAAGRLGRAGRAASMAAAAAAVAALAVLTVRQCALYADAETLWRGTIERNPGCWVAYGGLGDVYLRDGRVPEAVAAYERAIAIDASNVESHIDLGIALLREGRADEAIARFQAALAIDPGNAEAHNNLGNIFASKGRLDEAAAEYASALKSNPSDGRAHYNLGSVLMRMGRMREAAAEFRGCLSLDPGDFDARENLGIALMRLGQADEAVPEFRAALAIDPGNPGPHVNLGAILLGKGRMDEAIAEFQKALEADGSNADARYNLGNALMQAGRLDEAIAQFQMLVASDPRDREAHRALGVAFFKKGRIDEADEQLQEANRTR